LPSYDTHPDEPRSQICQAGFGFCYSAEGRTISAQSLHGIVRGQETPLATERLDSAVRIEVVRRDPAVALPAYAHRGDAGLDLAAVATVTLEPGGRELVPTGLRVAIPDGYAGLVMPRSGLALRSGVTVLNAPGLLDSGYRGEIGVLLVNHSAQPVVIQRGERIAQLVIQPVARAALVEVHELPGSRRGEGGFGSTGA
jgi:dUTP pyrophosphatase